MHFSPEQVCFLCVSIRVLHGDVSKVCSSCLLHILGVLSAQYTNTAHESIKENMMLAISICFRHDYVQGASLHCDNQTIDISSMCQHPCDIYNIYFI